MCIKILNKSLSVALQSQNLLIICTVLSRPFSKCSILTNSCILIVQKVMSKNICYCCQGTTSISAVEGFKCSGPSGSVKCYSEIGAVDILIGYHHRSSANSYKFIHHCERQREKKRSVMVSKLVSECFKPSQPQRIISGLMS